MCLCRVREACPVSRVLRDQPDHRYKACFLVTLFMLQSFLLEHLWLAVSPSGAKGWTRTHGRGGACRGPCKWFPLIRFTFQHREGWFLYDDDIIMMSVLLSGSTRLSWPSGFTWTTRKCGWSLISLISHMSVWLHTYTFLCQATSSVFFRASPGLLGLQVQLDKEETRSVTGSAEKNRLRRRKSDLVRPLSLFQSLNSFQSCCSSVTQESRFLPPLMPFAADFCHIFPAGTFLTILIFLSTSARGWYLTNMVDMMHTCVGFHLKCAQKPQQWKASVTNTASL